MAIDDGRERGKRKTIPLSPALFSHASLPLSLYPTGGDPTERGRPRRGGCGRVGGPERVPGGFEKMRAFFCFSSFRFRPKRTTRPPSFFEDFKKPQPRLSKKKHLRSNSGPRWPWGLIGSSTSTRQRAAEAARAAAAATTATCPLRPRAREPSRRCLPASSPRRGPGWCCWASRPSTGTRRKQVPCSLACSTGLRRPLLRKLSLGKTTEEETEER